MVYMAGALIQHQITAEELTFYSTRHYLVNVVIFTRPSDLTTEAISDNLPASHHPKEPEVGESRPGDSVPECTVVEL